jgi:hypothetical protein
VTLFEDRVFTEAIRLGEVIRIRTGVIIKTGNSESHRKGRMHPERRSSANQGQRSFPHSP